MSNHRETAGETGRTVLTDLEHIQMWSAERNVVPVYYDAEDRYELVPTERVTDDREQSAWDELSERFADRDEVFVHEETESGVESATFVDRARVLEQGRVDPNADVAGTTDPHTDGTATTDSAGEVASSEREPPATDSFDLDSSDRGKRVFDQEGNEIGIVEAVDEDASRLSVDPDPGVLDEVKVELGWGDESGDGYTIDSAQIVSREGHQIVVRHP